MVFILGNNFADRFLVKKALQSFFGIGPNVCQRIMATYHIHPTATVGEIGDKQVLNLTAHLTNMNIENDLRRKILDDIKRLRDTGTYRGRRHAMNLPVRGQRTRTQTRTAIKFNRIDRRL